MTTRHAPIAALCGMALGLVLAGCNSIGVSKPDAAMQTADDAYFVFGVEPPFTRIDFLGGKLKGDKFSPTLTFLQSDMVLMDEPTDGFVLGHVKGTRWLGVGMIQPHSSANAIVGPIYTPCARDVMGSIVGYNPAPAFEVPAGKVVYITSMLFRDDASGQREEFHNDLEGARAFLKKHYPNLADKLEQGSYQMLPPDYCDF